MEDLRIARVCRAQNDYVGRGGVTVIFDGFARGWVNELPNPESWCAGGICGGLNRAQLERGRREGSSRRSEMDTEEHGLVEDPLAYLSPFCRGYFISLRAVIEVLNDLMDVRPIDDQRCLICGALALKTFMCTCDDHDLANAAIGLEILVTGGTLVSMDRAGDAQLFWPRPLRQGSRVRANNYNDDVISAWRMYRAMWSEGIPAKSQVGQPMSVNKFSVETTHWVAGSII